MPELAGARPIFNNLSEDCPKPGIHAVCKKVQGWSSRMNQSTQMRKHLIGYADTLKKKNIPT